MTLISKMALFLVVGEGKQRGFLFPLAYYIHQCFSCLQSGLQNYLRSFSFPPAPLKKIEHEDISREVCMGQS
jgi:hypothetical protein